MVILLIIFIFAAGSIFLLASYIYSSLFSKTDFSESTYLSSNKERYIYNLSGTKLYADFNIINNSRNAVILYYGYGCNIILLDKLKNFYIKNNLSVITIYANGFKSSGKKKVPDLILKSDLELWLEYITDILGPNIKIILHGFSYTALSCLIVNTKEFSSLCAIISHCAHLYPVFLYKDVKNKFLSFIFKKKSKLNLSQINIPVFIASDNTVSKDACKIYDLCATKKTLYVYEKQNIEEYLTNLKSFLTKHLKLLEE